MRGSHKVLLLSLLGLFSQATSILLGIVLVRLYLPAEYGTFRQAFFLVETVAYICTIALPASLLYFLPGMSPERQKGMVLQTMLSLAALGLVGSVVLRLFSAQFSELFNNPELAEILPYFSFYPFLHATVQHVGAMYMGLDRYKTASLVQALVNLTKFLVIIAGSLYGLSVPDLMRLVLIYMAAQLGVVIVISLRPYQRIKAFYSYELLISQLQYAIPLGISGIVWFLGKEIDKYFVAAFVPPALYAIYAVGALEIPVFHEISIAISSVLVPKIAESHKRRDPFAIARLWSEVIRKSALIFVPSFGLLFLLAEPLIAILYTSKYLPAVLVFQAYLGLILLRIFNPNMILQGIGKTQTVLVSSVLFISVNAGLNYLALKVLDMGIIGPALATLAAFAFMNLWSTLAAARHLGVRPSEFLPFGYLFRISAVTLAAYGLPAFAFFRLESYWLQGIFTGLSFAAIFALGAKGGKLYTQDDLQLILGRFRKPTSAPKSEETDADGIRNHPGL